MMYSHLSSSLRVILFTFGRGEMEGIIKERVLLKITEIFHFHRRDLGLRTQTQGKDKE